MNRFFHFFIFAARADVIRHEGFHYGTQRYICPTAATASTKRCLPCQVAEDISPRLAKAAVAAEVDGQLPDLTTRWPTARTRVQILTDRDPEALEILRHTAAHVLAQAMVRLYGEDVQYTIGPALMDDFQYGFYYDFDLPAPISAEDLPKIEAEMEKIVGEKIAHPARWSCPSTQAKARDGRRWARTTRSR